MATVLCVGDVRPARKEGADAERELPQHPYRPATTMSAGTSRSLLVGFVVVLALLIVFPWSEATSADETATTDTDAARRPIVTYDRVTAFFSVVAAGAAAIAAWASWRTARVSARETVRPHLVVDEDSWTRSDKCEPGGDPRKPDVTELHMSTLQNLGSGPAQAVLLLIESDFPGMSVILTPTASIPVVAIGSHTIDRRIIIHWKDLPDRLAIVIRAQCADLQDNWYTFRQRLYVTRDHEEVVAGLHPVGEGVYMLAPMHEVETSAQRMFQSLMRNPK